MIHLNEPSSHSVLARLGNNKVTTAILSSPEHGLNANPYTTTQRGSDIVCACFFFELNFYYFCERSAGFNEAENFFTAIYLHIASVKGPPR